MREMPTREKGLALVEALTGWTARNPDGDPAGELKSPYVMAHLEASLGLDNVPALWMFAYPNGPEIAIARTDAFLDLLQSYVDALRPDGYPTRQVLLGLLAEYVSRDEAANQVVNGPPDVAGVGKLTERAKEALKGAGYRG